MRWNPQPQPKYVQDIYNIQVWSYMKLNTFFFSRFSFIYPNALDEAEGATFYLFGVFYFNSPYELDEALRAKKLEILNHFTL